MSGAPAQPGGVNGAWLAFRARLSAALATPGGRLCLRLFRAALWLVVLYCLGRELWRLDWPLIWANLPASPIFYIAGVARFLVLPMADAAAFSIIWERNLFRYFGVFIRKRVLNVSVASHTGDVYFMFWATRRLGFSPRRTLFAVKDAALLSGAAANGIALLILLPYLLIGDLSLFEALGRDVARIVIASIAVGAALTLLMMLFRRTLLAVPSDIARAVFGINVLRVLGGMAIFLVHWSAGLPGIGLLTWLNFLVLDLLVARAPFLPARELVFLTLTLTLTDQIAAPEGAANAMFLVSVALTQAISLLAFAAGALDKRRRTPEGQGERSLTA